MAQRQSRPLLYDPAPYDALAADQRQGDDVTQRVRDIICATTTRPGEIATRLNRAQVKTSQGSRWAWWDVLDVRVKAGVL
jgi:hypothetical protein